jgi:hypothetical protein
MRGRRRGGGSTGPCRLGGPAPGDELAVPAQDRGRRDDQAHAAPGWEETGESGDQGAVGPARPRTRDASAKDGELMAKDQDLDLFGAVRSNPQHHHAQKFGQHQVDQPQRHRPIMPGFRRRRTSKSGEVSRLSGTHRIVSSALAGWYSGHSFNSWPGGATGSSLI